MALIVCAECENSVSDKAASCPSCGAPTPLAQRQAQAMRTRQAALLKEAEKASKAASSLPLAIWQAIKVLGIIFGGFWLLIWVVVKLIFASKG